MTGSPASAPMSPSPRIAVPLVTTATVLPSACSRRRPRGSLLDREAHPRDARCVDIAQHLARVDRQRRHGADLAAAVAVEDAVGLADEARGRQLPDALVERAVGLLVHLERDLPERPALVASQRGELLDGEPRVGDDLKTPWRDCRAGGRSRR